MKVITAVVLLSVAFTNLASCVHADEKPIDEALLDDLGTELLKPTTAKPVVALDQQLLEQLGEDVGDASSTSTLR